MSAPIETKPTQPSAAPTEPTAAGPQSYSQSYSSPRITIQYCTQCKWMLRAAYFAQELLSTFSTDIGEVALVPRTGGIFTVTIFPSTASATDQAPAAEGAVLWDRKRDGGFPEVKELKSRVRNVIDPSRDLGHTDRALKKNTMVGESTTTTTSTGSTSVVTAPSIVSGPTSSTETCEDCK